MQEIVGPGWLKYFFWFILNCSRKERGHRAMDKELVESVREYLKKQLQLDNFAPLLH